MGKLQNIITNLAKEPAPKVDNEVGTSVVGSMPSIFNEEFIDVGAIKVEDYKKMLDSDGTVQALYSTIVMPILGSNWTIEADDAENAAAVEQSAWVEDVLRMPPHKGGMSTPFDLVLAQALRAVVEGFAGFEKVYEISDGKIVFKKIAWRDPNTVTMKTDDRGGFNGLRQRAFIGNDYVDVVIPLERCFVYTYGKEFHNLKGRSAFTSAYVAYDKKRRLLYLAEQQAQADALRIKIVTGKEGGSQETLDDTVEQVDEIGFKATVGVPFGYDVNTLNNTNGMDLLPLIEFQNAEMARSVLAMFILLGTGSDTGSYALSQDQSDFFIQALMAIRKSLEQHITSYLIPDLYKFNFERPEYGTFKFEDITDSTIELLQQTFMKLTEKDRLPDSVVEGVMQKMADKLEIDVDLMEEAVNGVQDPAPTAEVEPVVKEPPATKPASFALGRWKRELTKAENKVNFGGIENKLNILEQETERAIKPIWDALVKDAMGKITKLVEQGKYDKIVDGNFFDENLKNQYVKALKEGGLEAYIYGKNGASDELAVKAPATPKETKDYFKDNAITVVDKQLADLTFKIQSEVSKGRRKDQLSKTSLSTDEIIRLIGGMFSDYYSGNVGLGAIASASIGVNKGRKDVFAEYENEIYGYQYSAILDAKTCATCGELDGKVLNLKDYKKTSYDPPIHLDCRCIWVAIMNDEIDPPAYTGLDENKLTMPSLSKHVEEQIVELGKRAVQDEVTRLLAED